MIHSPQHPRHWLWPFESDGSIHSPCSILCLFIGLDLNRPAAAFIPIVQAQDEQGTRKVGNAEIPQHYLLKNCVYRPARHDPSRTHFDQPNWHIPHMDWNRFTARLCLFLFACHHQALAAERFLQGMDEVSQSPYIRLESDSIGASSSSIQKDTKSSGKGVMTKMFSKLGFKNDEDLSKEDQRELAKWLDVIYHPRNTKDFLMGLQMGPDTPKFFTGLTQDKNKPAGKLVSKFSQATNARQRDKNQLMIVEVMNQIGKLAEHSELRVQEKPKLAAYVKALADITGSRQRYLSRQSDFERENITHVLRNWSKLRNQADNSAKPLLEALYELLTRPNDSVIQTARHQ
ncbi:hypothetical protein PCANC_03673 [Puccinia coronata f. sp. avenae]|uniref:Uncharacterized protein n=1 Tax=Puccinia coronata f. sp. avenae TaxID=200324 RepID=A0A2N5VXR0_9BASI|nr:hypothetical protein PCANC_03673 [Puccinia coronata f. sp. avenae]